MTNKDLSILFFKLSAACDQVRQEEIQKYGGSFLSKTLYCMARVFEIVSNSYRDE